MKKGKLVGRKNLFRSFTTFLSAGYLLMASCNQGVEPGEPMEFNPELLPCTDLHIKDLAPFPVGFSYGNRQNHEGTQHILNEPSQITTTSFFATHIFRSENHFDFSGSDAAVEYASHNGKPIHTHCLVYAMESVNPSWLRERHTSKTEFEALMKRFITATVSRYKGKIRGHDIANELFAYNSSQVDRTWMRNKFSSDQEYFDFIGRCFRYAHEADPDALLFYNDYGQEYSNNNFEKGRAIAAQIKKWLDEGVPIHGYGLQVHTNIYRPIEHIESALSLAASTGLQIHISELDVSVNYADWDINGQPGGTRGLSHLNDDLKQRQREMYRKVADAYKRVVPKSQQYGITLWDLNDRYSWLNWNRFEAGTLFDVNYQRKPAFYGFLEGLTGRTFNCN